MDEEEILVKKDKKVDKEDYLKIKRSNERKKSVIVILLFAGVLMIITIGIYFVNDSRKDEPKDEKPEVEKSTFKYVDDNYGLASYGSAIVKGYAIVNDEEVSFHILSTDSEDFKKAMSSFGYEDGNIPLGCIKSNSIIYESAADEFGPDNYEGDEEKAYLYYTRSVTLSLTITNEITSSTKTEPITLRINKSPLTHYINLNDSCKTVITSVDLLEYE